MEKKMSDESVSLEQLASEIDDLSRRATEADCYGPNAAPIIKEMEQEVAALQKSGDGWVGKKVESDDYRNAIIHLAYRLYHKTQIDEVADIWMRGQLDKAGIGGYKNSPICRRLVQYAFKGHKDAEAKPEPARLTRWSGVVCYLYHCVVPRPHADDPQFADMGKLIAAHGGAVLMVKKWRLHEKDERVKEAERLKNVSSDTSAPLSAQVA
jgi:hypothetical protein